MSSLLLLRCACGRLRGEFSAIPGCGARGICYCNDCRAYGRFLAPARVLDEHGGTEVIQTWPARVRLTEGLDQLRLMRLSAKGLNRFYAGCCRTPVANTFAKPRMPFIGLVARFIDPAHAVELDAIFGKPEGVQGKFAPGGCPPGAHRTASAGIIARAVGLLLRGWWRGEQRPSPVFDADDNALAEAQILTRAEREAISLA